LTLPLSAPHTPAAFLDFLWGGYTDARGHLVTAVRSNGEGRGFEHLWQTPRGYLRSAADIAALGQHHDVYLAVALYGAQRRERAAVQALGWLWADLDEHSLASDLLPATLVMETSPGRTQALWSLDSPADADAVEGCVRAIAEACGLGNAAAAANQILRVPGTTNHGARKGRADALVQVTEYRPRAIYKLGAFDHLAPGVTPGTVAARIVPASPEASAFLWADVYPSLTERTRRLADGRDERGRDGKAYRSPSEGDYGLIVALARVGLTASEAGGVFLATTRGKACIGRHGLVRATMLTEERAARAQREVGENEATITIPPALIADDYRSDLYHLAVYASDAAYAVGSGWAWASNGRLAGELGISESTVKRARKALCDAKLITKGPPIGRANSYRIDAAGDAVRLPVASMRAIR
jgi:hypothetical protein